MNLTSTHPDRIFKLQGEEEGTAIYVIFSILFLIKEKNIYSICTLIVALDFIRE